MSQPVPGKNRRALITLAFTMVVAMLGFAMIIPILPFYITNFGAGGLELGLLMAIFSVMQLVAAPLWGSLSDRIGRKPVLIIGILGNALSLLLFGLSTELWMLFAARTLGGALSSAMMPTAMAYIGDVTSHHDRGSGMGVMGAAMGIGMVLGPGISGWLAEFSLSLPFFVGAAIALAAIVPVQLILPESLPRGSDGQRAASDGHSGLSAMRQSLSGQLGLMMLIAFLTSLGFSAFQGVFGLFALQRFSYGPQQVGTVMMLIGLISAVSQGGLIGPAGGRWGEVRVMRVSLVLTALAYLLMLLARDDLTVLLAAGFFALSSSFLQPLVSSLTSRLTRLGQGATMGVSNSFMSMGRAIGPLSAGALFDLDTSYPFLAGALVMLIAFVVAWLWLAEQPLPDSLHGDPLETLTPASEGTGQPQGLA